MGTSFLLKLLYTSIRFQLTGGDFNVIAANQTNQPG